MRIEFKMDLNYVKFPVSDGQTTEFINIPRPVAMPLKEMHGEKLLTLGHLKDSHLLAYQIVEKPYKIYYAHPVNEAIFDAILNDLKKGLKDEDVIKYITDHYLVVEESCNVYPTDRNVVDTNLKYSS